MTLAKAQESSDSTYGGDSHGCSEEEIYFFEGKVRDYFKDSERNEIKQTHISEQLSLPKSTVNTIWKNRETLKR